MVQSLMTKGNTKMGRAKVGAFNLPARETCTPTHWCLHGRGENKPACYALRNNYIFKNVQDALKSRYEASMKSDFVEKLVGEIQKWNPPFFRVHASGDFYNVEYVGKIIEVVEQCPDTLFRTSTRRRDLTSELQKLNDLPNMIVRESLDSERLVPEMGLPFAAINGLEIIGQEDYHCPNDCPECDYSCWKNDGNMYFDEH